MSDGANQMRPRSDSLCDNHNAHRYAFHLLVCGYSSLCISAIPNDFMLLPFEFLLFFFNSALLGFLVTLFPSAFSSSASSFFTSLPLSIFSFSASPFPHSNSKDRVNQFVNSAASLSLSLSRQALQSDCESRKSLQLLSEKPPKWHPHELDDSAQSQINSHNAPVDSSPHQSFPLASQTTLIKLHVLQYASFLSLCIQNRNSKRIKTTFGENCLRQFKNAQQLIYPNIEKYTNICHRNYCRSHINLRN